MDEDSYVPQISQIDYNLMDSGGANGSSSAPNYYNPINNRVGGMYGGGAEVAQQHQYQHPQMMPGQGMPHAYHPGLSTQMPPPHPMMGNNQMGQIPSVASQQQTPQQAATKPKRGGRKKNAANQQTANEGTSNTPTQQPLPASYPSHQMNPQMMQQMRQQQPNNPYNYQMQSQQKWPGTDYNSMQQQYRPMSQQPYPAYPPMHPSAQVCI